MAFWRSRQGSISEIAMGKIFRVINEKLSGRPQAWVGTQKTDLSSQINDI